MENEHVLSGLIRKRKELAGTIERLEAELTKATEDLAHVDGAILVFDPHVDLIDIGAKAPKPDHQAVRGEMLQAILDVLRASTEPMDVPSVAEAVIAARGLGGEDQAFLLKFRHRVRDALQTYRDKGWVKSAKGFRNILEWEIVR